MQKYYQISIDSLITTFSLIESGKEFYFNIKSEHSFPQDITVDDKIIASVEDKVYYEFIVTEIINDTVKLRKQFEISKSINLDFQTIGVFEQVNKDEYDLICSQLFNDFTNVQSLHSYNYDNIKEGFANWLFNLRKYSRVYKDDKAILIEKLNEYEIAYYNDFGIMIFDYPNVSIHDIINALESNVIEDLGEIGDLNKRTVGNGSVKAILGSQNYIKYLKDLLNSTKKAALISTKCQPINKIYFGSPGTGKSFRVTEDLSKVDKVFQKRVTFHPEYDNASFIGSYKPTSNDGNIAYEFSPQIFTNIYVEACNDPEHQYYLIIEEINRGNCAEIFGELFQLLDRDTNYDITPSKELINYLDNNIPNSKFYNDGKMLLPDNLSILATMNTSDQSLFPMDSAFKRRWEWEYIPINYSSDPKLNKSASYYIKLDATTIVKWVDFIEQINSRIQDNPSLGMDKCIGNYFVKPNEKNEISIEAIIYKVVFYLWNDVFKDEPKNSIFKGKITYQDFFPINDKGEKLLRSILYDLKLIDAIEKIEEPNTQS